MLRSLYLTTILLFMVSFLFLILHTTSHGLPAVEDLGFAGRLTMLLRRGNKNPMPYDPEFDIKGEMDAIMNTMFKTFGKKCDFTGVQTAWQGFYDSFGTWIPWVGVGKSPMNILVVRLFWWVLILFLAVMQVIWFALGSFAVVLNWVIDGMSQCV